MIPAAATFLGLVTVLIIIRLLYRKNCLAHLSVNMNFSTTIATEGDEAELCEVLYNAKWLPLPYVAVRFKVHRHLRFPDCDNSTVTDAYYRNDLFNILMHQRVTRRLNFTCTHRGFFTIDDLTLTGYDLLLERKHDRRLHTPAAITVYPGYLPVPERQDILNRVMGAIQTRKFTNPDPFTFRGIREYIPTDPVKAINFKATARTSDLMVNLWDFTITREVVLLLNLQRDTEWHDERLDEFAIKVASAFAANLAEQDIPCLFYTNGIGGISKSTTEIPSARGIAQLAKVNEALAHIDLHLEVTEDFPESLKRIFRRQGTAPEYWIISTYHSAPMQEAYQKMRGEGARCAWVLPTSRAMFFDKDNKDIALAASLRDEVIFI